MRRLVCPERAMYHIYIYILFLKKQDNLVIYSNLFIYFFIYALTLIDMQRVVVVNLREMSDTSNAILATTILSQI